MISIPACPARGASLATIPCSPNTARCPALCGHAAGKGAGRRSPLYTARPRSGARLGPPRSVAARDGVWVVRQESAIAPSAIPRRAFRLVVMAVKSGELLGEVLVSDSFSVPGQSAGSLGGLSERELCE